MHSTEPEPEVSFSGFSQTLWRSVCAVVWKALWAFRPGETQRENSRLSKLFHRTLAWANSLFLEVDAVFCELFSNLRNGDRRAAKTTRGEIKLVLSARNLCLLLGVCFFFFFSFLFVNVRLRQPTREHLWVFIHILGQAFCLGSLIVNYQCSSVFIWPRGR